MLFAGIASCVAGSTLRILLEFLLPKDGSLVAFGQYALQFGKAVAGLPAFMSITPEGNSSLLWDPEKDTCQQGERHTFECNAAASTPRRYAASGLNVCVGTRLAAEQAALQGVCCLQSSMAASQFE